MTYPTIIGLDPGPKKTGFVEYNHRAGLPIGNVGVYENEDLLRFLTVARNVNHAAQWIACERMAPQGRVGYEVLDTVVWSGRLCQRATDLGYGFAWVYRQASVCRNLLGTFKGNDALIRAALIARFGMSRLQTPTGKKVATHGWAALAVAVTFADTKFP